MDYSDINLFKLMKMKMDYHSQRQDVIARNLANIDTPGEQARDLKPLDFNRLVSAESHRLEIRATSPNHIQQGTKKAGTFRDEESRKTYETTPVKNNIVLEEQSAKLAENQMEYQKVTNLYGKVSMMFKTAIGNRN